MDDFDLASGRPALPPVETIETTVLPGDVASAGRSCSAILIILAILFLVICSVLGIRWFGGA